MLQGWAVSKTSGGYDLGLGLESTTGRDSASFQVPVGICVWDGDQ